MNKLALAASVALLAGCSGGSGSDPASTTATTGTLSIGLTDAPIDDVYEVVVEFSGITLQPADGERVVEVFDTPKSIDLLQFQGGSIAELLPGTSVPAGEYNWIRLQVNAEFDGIFDSYARMSEGGDQIELRVPGGAQAGLQLNSGFTVLAGQSTNLVIDWDLRKALTNPNGQPGWFLRRALRVTDLAEFGTLEGGVDALLVNDEACANDLAEDVGNVVYVFAGAETMPEDIQGVDATDPLVTANVMQDENGDYRYAVNFLPVGDYTVAFSCTGLNDDPEADDAAEDEVEPFIFTASQGGVGIRDGETTTVDFAPSE